ncbi:hypothetical protein HYX70_01150 [Candidatus Saccharibacteria bacterium]|nr:hypothetical protein [Candidatus Saccharibacteria bacterium]
MAFSKDRYEKSKSATADADPAMKARALELLQKVALEQLEISGGGTVKFNKEGVQAMIDLCGPDFLKSFPDVVDEDANKAFKAAMLEIIDQVLT